jgi:hypothetical protein
MVEILDPLVNLSSAVPRRISRREYQCPANNMVEETRASGEKSRGNKKMF